MYVLGLGHIPCEMSASFADVPFQLLKHTLATSLDPGTKSPLSASPLSVLSPATPSEADVSSPCSATSSSLLRPPSLANPRSHLGLFQVWAAPNALLP